MQTDIGLPERDTIELISAAAACRSIAEPVDETLHDLGLGSAALAKASAHMNLPETFNNPRPDASKLHALAADGFVSALSVIIIPRQLREGRRVAAIARPFGYIQTVKNQRIAVVAPSRYETDFASIPAFARFLISPFGRHAEAAVIHDWLYTIGAPGDAPARRIADTLFREALKELGVNWALRQVMYLAVRIGGARSFGKKTHFSFRRLSDLEPIQPAPTRDPYLRTVSVRPAR